MRRRVVVTGIGMISPLGIGVEASWQAACAGKSGIGEITRFDATDYPTRIAGEVKGFNAEDFIAKKQVKRMDIFIHYALAAAKMAMEDARLIIDEKNATRVGVITGSGLGGLGTIEQYHTVLLNHGPRRVTPFFIPMVIPNMACGHISITYGAQGPNISTTTACAAGSHAIGEAFRKVAYGLADAMICGGVESVVTPLTVASFGSMKALSTRNEDPERASRPFEKDRDGFIIGEGSGILIIEELQTALDRGAKIYAEITGYGCNSDAYHMTAPGPDGEGAARCMQMALDDAGVSYKDIDYINAHGTSTPLNDLSETRAIKTVFRERSRVIPVSSTKSMTGHLLGGGGGVEAIFSILSIVDGIAPPTINYVTPDPECDLDYVPNEARRLEIKTAMSNSFGFGGTNAVLIFKRFEAQEPVGLRMI
ncbi:MAG: beta-ketoacyl-ACP synthase II [Pseudomonadota bacterium]